VGDLLKGCQRRHWKILMTDRRLACLDPTHQDESWVNKGFSRHGFAACCEDGLSPSSDYKVCASLARTIQAMI